MTPETATDPVADDLLLLRRYREGSVDAFMAIYHRHVRPLLAYARTLTRDDALSEDLVQDAFLRILRHDANRIVASLKAFLYTSIRNAAIDRTRRLKVRHGHESPPRCVHSPGPDFILDAIDLLPAEQREAVILRVYSGMTFEEIGELLGVPLQTAASRYRYALEKLAGLLSEHGGEA